MASSGPADVEAWIRRHGQRDGTWRVVPCGEVAAVLSFSGRDQRARDRDLAVALSRAHGPVFLAHLDTPHEPIGCFTQGQPTTPLNEAPEDFLERSGLPLSVFAAVPTRVPDDVVLAVGARADDVSDLSLPSEVVAIAAIAAGVLLSCAPAYGSIVAERVSRGLPSVAVYTASRTPTAFVCARWGGGRCHGVLEHPMPPDDGWTLPGAPPRLSSIDGATTPPDVLAVLGIPLHFLGYERE